MDLLKFLNLEADALILEAESGQKYQLEITDELRQAIKREAAKASGPNHLSPRFIQDEVRSGKTLEQLAASTGESIEFLEKFAAPVLDEMQHVVDLARATRVNLPAERGNEFVQHSFGNLVEERLAERGITDISWSAQRAEGGPWVIHCRESSGEVSARWEFDPRKLILTPDNPLAVELGTTQRAGNGPRLLVEETPRVQPAPLLTTELEDTQALSQDVIPFPARSVPSCKTKPNRLRRSTPAPPNRWPTPPIS